MPGQPCLVAVCVHRLAPCASWCGWDESSCVLPDPNTTAAVLALPSDMVAWGRLLYLVLAYSKGTLLQSSSSLCSLCTNRLRFLGLRQCPHCPLLPCCSHKLLHLPSVCQQLSRSCAEQSRAEQSLSLSLTHRSMLPWQCTVCCTLGLQEPEMMVLLQH